MVERWHLNDLQSGAGPVTVAPLAAGCTPGMSAAKLAGPALGGVPLAGYLLAFAALGYTWAAGPTLDDARAAIASVANRPPDREQGYLLRTELPGPWHHSVNLVINVADPAACVIDRAATGVSVVLPAPGQRTVPSSPGGDCVGQFFPWPRTAFVKGRDVDKAHLDGHLFHLDFCNYEAHQSPPRAVRRTGVDLWLPPGVGR